MTRTTITLGPRAPPAPHAEAPLARRTAIVAFVFLAAASLHLAVEGVTLASLQRTFPLYALGGLATLIFGTSRLLIAGMAGRDAAGGRASAISTATLSAVGAAALYLAQDASLAARVGSSMVWSAGALTHVIVTIVTVNRPPTRPPITDPTLTEASRIPLRILEVGSLLYAAASAVLLPIAYADIVTRASAIHLVLVGFISTTIMSVASHILPRFTRARIPTTVLVALPPFALAGPALMALGLDARPALIPWGGLVEGGAFVIFAAATLTPIVRAHRLARPPNLAYAAAPILIGAGGLLALLFALRGSFADQLATHGLLAVFGFVGLVVVAASTDLYAPALDAGAAPARRHAILSIVSVTSALALAAVGTWTHTPPLARAGMLLYALAILWQLSGIAASHRRAERVVARFGLGRPRP